MIDSNTYGEAARRTVNKNYDSIIKRLTPEKIGLLEAILGLNGESGELAEAFKKWLFYGKELDIANLKEEIGDMYWYSSRAVDCLRTTINEIMTGNIEKLRKRYPDKFSEEDAINRMDKL